MSILRLLGTRKGITNVGTVVLCSKLHRTATVLRVSVFVGDYCLRVLISAATSHCEKNAPVLSPTKTHKICHEMQCTALAGEIVQFATHAV